MQPLPHNGCRAEIFPKKVQKFKFKSRGKVSRVLRPPPGALDIHHIDHTHCTCRPTTHRVFWVIPTSRKRDTKVVRAGSCFVVRATTRHPTSPGPMPDISRAPTCIWGVPLDVFRGQGMMPSYRERSFCACQPLPESGSPTRHSAASTAYRTQRKPRATPAGKGNGAFYRACGIFTAKNPLG